MPVAETCPVCSAGGWGSIPQQSRDAMTPLWSALLAAAREAALSYVHVDPPPGTMVLEISSRNEDPESIGYLVAHGDAPLHEDGTGPVREVWDVRPIGSEQAKRWENAEFVALPPRFRALVEALHSDGLLRVTP